MQQLFLPQKQKAKSAQFVHPKNIQPEGLIKEIIPVRKHAIKIIFYYLGCLVTVGLLYLLSRWFLRLWIILKCVRTDPTNASYFVVYGMDNSETIVKAKRIRRNNQELILLEFRLYRYYFDEETNIFTPLQTNFTSQTNAEILENYGKGHDSSRYNEMLEKYGKNDTEIPDNGVFRTLVDEVLSPFYIFQFFSVVLWYFSTYEKYATVILISSVGSIIITLIESRQNFKRLQDLSKFNISINVLRKFDNQNRITVEKGKINICEHIEFQRICSLDLVPGDIVQIEDKMIFPCDMIQLNGQCIVNESMLTGESIPVVKSAIMLSNILYAPNDEGKQFTLFAGTQCMETKIPNKGKIPILALVSETGFNTQKGQLIRSIMFPQQNSLKFYNDAMKFVGVMAIMAVIGFAFTLKSKLNAWQNEEMTTWELISEGLDLITITVPPALPTSLQIGISIALTRLRRLKIFCISPPRVNTCGKVTIMCFDKTGTLTEEGLDLWGIRPVIYSKKINGLKFSNKYKTIFLIFLIRYQNCQHLIEDDSISFHDYRNQNFNQGDSLQLITARTFVEIMASCHGLAWVNQQLIGDPLEVKLFEATGWKLQEEVNETGLLATIYPQRAKEIQQISNEVSLANYDTRFPDIGLVKRFDFSSKLQRMSVIVRNIQDTNEFRVHVKGSPEKLRELCNPQSLPKSFHKILNFYSQNGFRVLAVGSKVMKDIQVSTIQREEVECDLTFLGFLVMENKLKDATNDTICGLNQANIRTIMVTGDNVLTAISVARKCGIIHENQRVYLGELSEKKLPNGKYTIHWKDFDRSFNQLNPDNLNLDQFIEDQPDEETEEQLIEEVMSLRKTFEESNREKDYIRKMPKNSSLREEPPPGSIPGLRSNSQILKIRKSSIVIEEEEQPLDEMVLPWDSDTGDYVLALSGGAFNHLIKERKTDLLKRILEKGQVYARMRPEEKAILVKQIQDLLDRKPLVGFCGDGANDCGALKGADVGVSLSQAEASIAAPFTSQIQDISCIPLVLSEGRAALTTSFNCFKFMALFSVIQFAQVTVLYLAQSNLTDNQYLFNDLFTIFPLSMTIGFTQANPKLNKYTPSGALISFTVLASVIGQSLIVIIFQLYIYYLLQQQQWFISTQEANADNPNINQFQLCFENTTLFLFGNFQYIAIAIAFAVGKPFRKPFYTNIWLMLSIITLLGLDIVFVIFRFEWLDDILGLTVILPKNDTITEMPQSWLFLITIIAFINGVINILWERVIIYIVRVINLKKSQVKPQE